MFDVKSRAWSQRLIGRARPGPRHPSQMIRYESPEITGKIMLTAAKELGLKPGVPVVGGGGDQAAAQSGTASWRRARS